MDKVSSPTESPLWSIQQYSPLKREEWDKFIRFSRNGTFLFERHYMDYHADRFDDYSLMAYRGNVLSAVLPANRTGELLTSHGGLTYGGWVLPQGKIDGADEMELWDAWFGFCKESGIREIDYKPVPYIYATEPSEEDRYLLFRCGAEVTEVNLSSCIDLRHKRGFNKLQKRHLRKAVSAKTEVWETEDVEAFMQMIDSCLAERHGASAVHTAAEMNRLKTLFCDKIRFFVAGREGVIEGGVCIYETSTVAHCQYIGTTERGREGNVLSVLFDYLINERYSDKDYFDFGTSNENHGEFLNAGLLRQKFSLGGSGVAYPRYRITL